MSLAPTISSYLCDHQISYQILNHPLSKSSLETAIFAEINPDQLVKALVLENSAGELAMVLTTANKKIQLHKLNRQLHRSYTLVPEFELEELFRDCELGAIPGLGQAYGLTTYVDSALLTQPDLYVEAGDHQELIHFSDAQFHYLMSSAIVLDNI
ncbi:YbaK/EbsC family protein [Oceanicoccus sp. KOV_DT_Chl]|uniref:YbaK/EbsC family protein n=1 Tax=Oceanicoccus sp. KOV_DT_Chl TaxID=1904639 RepID=UPI000C7D413B|nr:YbaK/EbsC family protein [Oceanicoccus sp. KOV_DT_Chl]